MRDKEQVYNKLNEFIKSDSKHCLICGTNVQEKHKDILRYLMNLNLKMKVLIRLSSMQDSEYILGFKVKTGEPVYGNNLTLYVDSMQYKSQEKTPREFNCILIYPIASLKGIKDNNIEDILNHRNSEKVFWISNHDNVDYSYLKEICNIENIIEINHKDDEIHNRILENCCIVKDDSFSKLYVDDLYSGAIEEAINNHFKLGGIYTSSMGNKLVEGSFGEYIFGGERASKSIVIKVNAKKKNDKYELLVKQK